ncbi:MAG: hypothetical protein LBK99_20045 [Opitutaceae bacterium]|jgi:hypothetical protein|nr:hypothetical protein [Opitutaceae bacterium]
MTIKLPIIPLLLLSAFTASSISTPAFAAAPAAPAASAKRHPNMGVATHFGGGHPNIGLYWRPDELFPLIDELGVGWIRDGTGWGVIEPEKGRYHISEQRRYWIEKAHALGINICFILGNEKGHPLYKNPYDPEAYARAAAFLAREFAGKIQAIEVMNEPANFGFTKHFGGTWNGINKDGSVQSWLAKYVEILNATARAVKAVNPDIKVIGLGSVSPVNFRQLAIGLAPEVDGIVDHPYSFRTVPELIPYAASPHIIERDGIATADEHGAFASQIRMYREQSARYKGPREIWHTEWGFPSYQEPRAGLIYSGVTEEAQAKYALRRFMQSLALGINVSVWYDLKNDGSNPHDAEHNFGLLDTRNKPKPVWHAIRRLASFMKDYTPVPRPPEINITTFNTRTDQWPITWDGGRLAAPGTVMSYLFHNDTGQHMLAVWSTERAGGDLQPRVADIEIMMPNTISGVKSFDLWTGETSPMKFEQKPGRLRLPAFGIPSHPVAIIIE